MGACTCTPEIETNGRKATCNVGRKCSNILFARCFGSKIGSSQAPHRISDVPNSRPMSFFGQLRNTAEQAQETQRAQEMAAVQRFIRGWVEKFQNECAAAARRGDTSASKELLTEEIPRGRYYNRDAVAQELAESLRNLGAQVQVGAWRNKNENGVLRVPPWLVADITAEWGQAPTSPPEARATSGHVGSCPICMETRPVVALVPCGHTVCGTCRRSHPLQQCPMCRRQVTTATEGLFLQ